MSPGRPAARLELPCPMCDAEITVTITPPVRATAWDAPPKRSQVDEVMGCPHALALAESDGFLALVSEAVTEAIALLLPLDLRSLRGRRRRWWRR